ncbi:MAG: histidine kinase [Spirochaetales bacterium]|nr:histidine kinase [Candidatus Physcosoma equi]
MKLDRNLWRIFRRHSIPVLLAVIMLGLSSVTISILYTKSNTEAMAENILHQVIIHYDSVMDEIDAINSMLTKNQDILTNLKQVHDVEQMDYQLFRETQLVKSFMTSSANTRDTISSIFLYVENDGGYILYSGSGYEKLKEVGEDAWVAEYMKKAPSPTLESERHGYNIIRLSRPVLDRDKEKIGVIIVDVRISEMTNLFEDYPGRATPLLSVTNEKGEELFSYAKNRLEGGLFTREMTSSKYGWNYTISYSMRQIFAPAYTILLFTLLSIIVAALVGLFLTYKTNEVERRFISNLIDALNKAGAELEEPEGDGNIFSKLDDLILKHFLEQDYLKLRAEALEYRALQLQINPHFLFNSLNNMYWKSIKMAGGENDLSQMIKLLSALMKHFLKFDNLKGIPLKEELEAVDTYILLQHFRFKDTFTFSSSIPEALMDYPVPSMVFQPILENAFNHGFMEGKQLNIELLAKETEDSIEFTIRDDGNPFPEAVLEGIRDKNAMALKTSSSLGLLNTRDRVSLFYNRKGEMYLENKDGFATVTIMIPRTKEE